MQVRAAKSLWPPSSAGLLIPHSNPWLSFPIPFSKVPSPDFYFSQTYSTLLQTHLLSSDDMPPHVQRKLGAAPSSRSLMLKRIIFVLVLASPLPPSRGLSFFTLVFLCLLCIFSLTLSTGSFFSAASCAQVFLRKLCPSLSHLRPASWLPGTVLLILSCPLCHCLHFYPVTQPCFTPSFFSALPGDSSSVPCFGSSSIVFTSLLSSASIFSAGSAFQVNCPKSMFAAPLYRML